MILLIVMLRVIKRLVQMIKYNVFSLTQKALNYILDKNLADHMNQERHFCPGGPACGSRLNIIHYWLNISVSAKNFRLIIML